jgi:hypothetical protein
MDYLFLPFDFLYRIATANSDPFNEKKLNKGKRYANTCHCVIGTLLRDAEDSYNYSVNTIEKFSKIFKTLDIFILENGSKDNTRKLYQEYKCPNNVKIFIDSPKNNKYLKYKTRQHEINEKRIQKMVFLRNNLLDNIRKKSRKFENTYIFITDLDIKGNLNKKGIYDTFYYFYKRKEIEAIGCNGLKWNYFYFDDYAYKNKENKIHSGIDVPINQGLYRVKSTFSGGVFYRSEILLNLKYKYKEKKGKIICEHVTLNEKIPKIYINTNMIYNILEN